MTGRNSRPDNDGPASSPSRLEQFGEKREEEAKKESKEKNESKTCGC